MNTSASSTPLTAELEQVAHRQGLSAALELALSQLRRENRWHEYFDVRLLALRWQAGLPAVASTAWDTLSESQRLQIEEIYLTACREVGQELAHRGQFREAWMYLRPTGQREELRAALEAWGPPAERVAEALELGAQEGLAPAWAVGVSLAHYGTCNTISLIDGCLAQWTPADRQQAIGRLVRHLHAELQANVRHHVEQQTQQPAPAGNLEQWTSLFPWLTENDNYHLDTSHLSSTVRLARLVEDPEVLKLAVDLTAYGARLSPLYQLAAEPPFAELYPAHRRFFAAQLGIDQEQSLEYFRHLAEQAAADQAGLWPVEVYVFLLARLQRWEEALAAGARWLPPGSPLAGLAPTPWELAVRSGRFAQLAKICAAREDVPGLLVALAAQERPSGVRCSQ